MLSVTQEEIDHVTQYMRPQEPGLEVQFVQKVYSEHVLHVRHDVWDVHTNADRWWIVTAPINLYAQEQIPNPTASKPARRKLGSDASPENVHVLVSLLAGRLLMQWH